MPQPESVTRIKANERVAPRDAIAREQLGVGGVEVHLDADLTGAGDRVAGVDAEVEQRGLELRAVDEDRAVRVVEHDLERDGLADAADERALLELAEQRADVVRARRELLLTGEGEEPLDELRAVERGLPRVLEDLCVVRVLGLEQHQVAADDRQEVVEVVRDAAGEALDRLQLRAVAQHRLLLKARRDVLPDADDAEDRGVTRPPRRRALRSRWTVSPDLVSSGNS